jgi:hypothetical protein
VRREEEEWRLLERAECREARDTDISLYVPQHAQIFNQIKKDCVIRLLNKISKPESGGATFLKRLSTK